MSNNGGKVRYAVVGLGHLSQKAILPAFRNVKNATLTALVSGDADKLKELGAHYGARTFSYDQYDDCLQSGEVDAVYIVLPNDLHKEYTVRAAQAGVHVLCEKPMAVTEQDCAEMIRACEQNNTKLMIAYRLHFEAANLSAIEIANSGKLGEVRSFHSVFGMQVRPGNIRTKAANGGGSVYDIGVYCINAARYIFREEPEEVMASLTAGTDERFTEIDEMTSVVMKFPHGRLATFTSSFNAASFGHYVVLGTKGHLRVDPAFVYGQELKHYVTIDGKTEETTFPNRDQFGSQMDYLADCIVSGRDPEPDGWEGMADVQIVEGIYKSAQSGRPVKLAGLRKDIKRADRTQESFLPPIEPDRELVKVEAPTL
ncbi:MAG TPA: Gfo/Idh/MocA family oxidoreductase [Bryobacteraceae bacterium]|nr:Gfo/Idh/MocA family oxidoreductase [Bryobacteraceae bacterium]